MSKNSKEAELRAVIKVIELCSSRDDFNEKYFSGIRPRFHSELDEILPYCFRLCNQTVILLLCEHNAGIRTALE